MREKRWNSLKANSLFFHWKNLNSKDSGLLYRWIFRHRYGCLFVLFFWINEYYSKFSDHFLFIVEKKRNFPINQLFKHFLCKFFWIELQVFWSPNGFSTKSSQVSKTSRNFFHYNMRIRWSAIHRKCLIVIFFLVPTSYRKRIILQAKTNDAVNTIYRVSSTNAPDNKRNHKQ